MTGGQLATLIRRMRCAAVAGQPGGLGDADLLRRFVADRDEAAFEVLLWRHGAMVLNVCRRVLGHEQDAEDAFQATFLALARKAGTVARHASLGGWLYRVAHRAALAARQRRGRDVARQALAADVPGPVAEPVWLWRDLRPVLDEEVSRLPERQRLPFILCYLEGKTNAEAARELGLPEGTVASRLSAARRRLRVRLTRRGLALPAGALAAGLAARAGSAAVAPALAAATVRAAVWFTGGKGTTPAAAATTITLTEGVLRAMWMTQLKLVAAMLLAVGILGGGAGLLAYRLGAAEPPAAPGRPIQAAAADPGKEAARGHQAEEEKAKRLNEARKRVEELRARLWESEKRQSDQWLEVSDALAIEEDSLRAMQRRQDRLRQRVQSRIKVAERQLSDALERENGEKAALLEKQLDKLYDESEVLEAKFFQETLPQRRALIKRHGELQLLERQQTSERDNMQADLEAAEAKVRWLQGYGPDPTARGSDVDRKLDALLREVDALRRQLRQRGPDRGDRPE